MTSSDQPGLDELAVGAIDEADLRALDAVARLYAALDPVPAGLVERSQFGITLAAMHAEIAELQRTADLVGVRADNVTDAHTVTFTSASLTIMVTITPLSADRVRIDGWMVPGDGVRVELRSRDEVTSQTTDTDGRFVFADVPRGLAQFVARHPEGSPSPVVITPSIEL